MEMGKHALFTSDPWLMMECWKGEAGRVAPIEHENEGEMDHSMALKNTEKGRQRKN
jgi:hypothetical protein